MSQCKHDKNHCDVANSLHELQVEQTDGSVDALRQEPIGEDSKGNLYYYFSFNNEDCRLYRQEPATRKAAKRRRSNGEDTDWETVCTSVEEMADFVESLSVARLASSTRLLDIQHVRICSMHLLLMTCWCC